MWLCSPSKEEMCCQYVCGQLYARVSLWACACVWGVYAHAFAWGACGHIDTYVCVMGVQIVCVCVVCLFKKNYIHDPWFDKIMSSLCLSYSLWLLALSYCSLSPWKTRKRRAYRFLMVIRWKYNYSLCDFWFGLGIYSCTLSWGNRSVCCMDLSQHDA